MKFYHLLYIETKNIDNNLKNQIITSQSVLLMIILSIMRIDNPYKVHHRSYDFVNFNKLFSTKELKLLYSHISKS